MKSKTTLLSSLMVTAVTVKHYSLMYKHFMSSLIILLSSFIVTIVTVIFHFLIYHSKKLQIN